VKRQQKKTVPQNLASAVSQFLYYNNRRLISVRTSQQMVGLGGAKMY